MAEYYLDQFMQQQDGDAEQYELAIRKFGIEKTCECGKKFTTLRKGRKLCDFCPRGKLLMQGYIKETNHDPQN